VKKEISFSCSKEAGTEGNAEKTKHVDISPPEWCQNYNIKIGYKYRKSVVMYDGMTVLHRS
jgi:hypothetical protein